MLAGQPLIAHTLAAFQECPRIDEIVLVLHQSQLDEGTELVRESGFAKVKSIIPGGEVRQDSVRNGLAQVSPEVGIIVIHDGARPLVTSEIITASIEAAETDGAAVVMVPAIDTIKTSLDGEFVTSTLDREQLYSTQTPQTFARGIIMEAYERAYADCYWGTDDSSLVERLGIPVRLVQGSHENIKVTTPLDILVAETVLKRRSAE